MKPFLLLVLIAFFPALQQAEPEVPDLHVVKFDWVKEKEQHSSMIRGAKNPGGPVTSAVNDGRDLGSRKAEIRTIGKRAADEKPAPSFHLRLEVKNTGANVVRGLIWEYRPAAGSEDYQPKRYLCALQVESKEKKVLEVWTPYLPEKVISAKEGKDLLKDGTVVIDQIEYADGSIWKKSGWNYRLPADALQKLSEGTCSVF